MSKETDQTLVMLSTVAGCIQTLLDTHAFARVDIQHQLRAGFAAAQQAIIDWPGFTNREWIKTRREQFNEFIFLTPDEGFQTAAIVKMMDRMTTDLLERDRGLQRKIAMLKPIHDAVRVVDNFNDADGRNFPAYEKSSEILDELYRIIDFRVV